MTFARIFGAALFLALLSVPVAAQPDASTLPQLPPHAAPTARIQTGNLPVMDTTPAFDPEKATAKYLSKVGGAARARSDAYFEGDYWLQLLDLIYAFWRGRPAVMDGAGRRASRIGRRRAPTAALIK